MTIAPYEYRRTIGLFATGVTVITVSINDMMHGMTANAVASASLDPLLVLACVDRRARMCGMLVEAERFAINILRADQEMLSRHFGGRPQNDINVTFTLLEGVPILRSCLAILVCTKDRIVSGGDHLIVFGRVTGLQRHWTNEPPLLFYDGRYHHLALPMAGDHVPAPESQSSLYKELMT